MLQIFLTGVLATLVMWRVQQMDNMVVRWHWRNFLRILRRGGESISVSSNEYGATGPGESDDKGDADKGGKGAIHFTPEQQEFVNKTIDTKYAKWKQEEAIKYRDYEELAKFKQEHLKAQDAKAQEELIKAKKFEEVERNYQTKLNEFGQLVSKKDQEITDLKISHHLTNEINRQNGYTEETLALVKANAVLDANGNVVIKTKDANGMDATLTVADGIKKVLEARPYLVKSTHKQGGGTGAGEGSTGTTTPQGADELMTLNAQMQEAMRTGDWKKTQELKSKIRAKMNSRVAHV